MSPGSLIPQMFFRLLRSQSKYFQAVDKFQRDFDSLEQSRGITATDPFGQTLVSAVALLPQQYRGMRRLLSSKDCVRFGIVKRCQCILEDIVFGDDEVLPLDLVAGQPHELRYSPYP